MNPSNSLEHFFAEIFGEKRLPPTKTPDELETAEGIVAMSPDEEATQVLLRG